MEDYSYLDEMRIRFASTRLKEYMSEVCKIKNLKLDIGLTDEKKVGLGDYVFRKSLSMSLNMNFQIEDYLKKNNIPQSKFPMHHDTLILQLMTWIRFSINRRSVEGMISKNSRIDESKISFDTCIGFYSAYSQHLMADLLGSGSEDKAFKDIDLIIVKKVNDAFDRNEKVLRDSFRKETDSKATFAYLLLEALKENSKDSFRFALAKWKLSPQDKKDFESKLDAPVDTEVEKMVALIFFKTISTFEVSIDNLYKEFQQIYALEF